MAQESLENKRKRLIYRSWHRGTKEMDLLLGTFADRHVPEFSVQELAQYEDLLQISDPDLYDWITEKSPVPANLENEVLLKLLSSKFVSR